MNLYRLLVNAFNMPEGPAVKSPDLGTDNRYAHEKQTRDNRRVSLAKFEFLRIHFSCLNSPGADVRYITLKTICYDKSDSSPRFSDSRLQLRFHFQGLASLWTCLPSVLLG